MIPPPSPFSSFCISYLSDRTTIHPGLCQNTGCHHKVPFFSYFTHLNDYRDRASSFNDILAIFHFFLPIAIALIQVLIITMDHGHSHLAGSSASRSILFNSFSTQSPNDLFKMYTSAYPIVEYHSKVINVLSMTCRSSVTCSGLYPWLSL